PLLRALDLSEVEVCARLPLGNGEGEPDPSVDVVDEESLRTPVERHLEGAVGTQRDGQLAPRFAVSLRFPPHRETGLEPRKQRNRGRRRELAPRRGPLLPEQNLGPGDLAPLQGEGGL